MDSSHTVQAWAGNIFSIGAIAGAIVGYLPTAAAIVGLVWYLIQVYESATIQRWLAARRSRKIARLKARVLMLEAQGKPLLPGPFDPDAPKHH